jgi:beta-glucosidase/6-phospho-beta-glucosidase/beta-galactosidase
VSVHLTSSNLEWDQGFVPRYGLTHVDKTTEAYTRIPKDSAFTLGRLFGYLRKQE